MSRYIDIDDDRNFYIGPHGEYEIYNIHPDVLAEAITELDNNSTKPDSRNDDLIRELAEVMWKGSRNGDIMQLPSYSFAAAESLRKEVIRIIEELTQERWDFSYISW